jgi:hypothetical protein
MSIDETMPLRVLTARQLGLWRFCKSYRPALSLLRTPKL